MMLSLLTVVTVTLGFTAVYVLTVKAKEAALAGADTVVGLGDASTDTLSTGGDHLTPSTRTDWRLSTVSALCDAEEMLDVLEYQGYAERELVVLGNSCFAVRWR